MGCVGRGTSNYITSWKPLTSVTILGGTFRFPTLFSSTIWATKQHKTDSPLSYELLVGWCKDSYFHLLYLIPLKTVGGFNLSGKHIGQLGYLPTKNASVTKLNKKPQKSVARFPFHGSKPTKHHQTFQHTSKEFTLQKILPKMTCDLMKNGRDSS